VRAWLVVRRMGRLGLSLWGSSGGVRACFAEGWYCSGGGLIDKTNLLAGEATFDAAFR